MAARKTAATTDHASLGAALLAFQGEVTKVGKDSINSYFEGHRYASLQKVMEVVRPVLQVNGLVISQVLDNADGAPALRTILMHASSGDRLEGTCPFPENLNAQQMGSAVTYFRRYGLLAVLGLVPDDDDDGNLASQAPAQAPAAAVSSSQALPAAPGATVGDASLGGAI